MRPGFQLISGTEYLVSARAIGARSGFCALAAIAPQQVLELHRLCRDERYEDARKLQEDLGVLRKMLGGGPAALKAASRAMGRDCGAPRPPLEALRGPEFENLAARLAGMKALTTEPRGW